MISITQPNEESIRRFLKEQSTMPFSYSEVGASQEVPAPFKEALPPVYRTIRRQVELGQGEECYKRAQKAIIQWKMTRLGWVEPFSSPSIEIGKSFATVARLFGLWFVNPGRIVYIVDETDEDTHTFGFAFGTLPGHVMGGEERFAVSWSPKDDVVRYELTSFSRPRHPLARIGFPILIWQQKRFGDHSLRAMQQATKA